MRRLNGASSSVKDGPNGESGVNSIASCSCPCDVDASFPYSSPSMIPRISANFAGAFSSSHKVVLPNIKTKCSKRCFSASSERKSPNRIYTPVRSEDELDTLLLLSASSNRPLITLWTASFCSTCAKVAPLIKELVENEGIGENVGGLGFAQVEVDAPTSGSLGFRYAISSLPTLLAFSRQDARLSTKVTNAQQLQDQGFVRQWLEVEARQKLGSGEGGTGGKKQ
ncbi:hypothetical protein EV356DRAFT_10465 [Viridothelium virens]|uniref:Thioredoxin domain-containing protein n=1 Tax=Viridothelium virens TaxID=1048519 RepID=A0A6A6HPQ9_VIRVR|nr:hypothetical protein EV356DRAFT_10465 [Viridothelium virens]